MNRDTERLVMVGGIVVGGAAIAGLLYILTKSSKGDAPSAPQPPQRSTKGTLSGADLDKLIEATASTRSGPDYEWDINFGDWGVRRERKLAFTNLAKGSIVRLSMYPLARANDPVVFQYAAQITEVIPMTGFTIYKAKWVNTPGGLSPDQWVAFTSSDISSVIKAVARS